MASSAGLILDPWQAYVLEASLGERRDGKWAAREVGLIVSRQNGKGSILEARELAGLFLLDEMELVHTAHQFKTSADHFLRIKSLIVNTPDLFRQVRPRGVRESHGEEGVTLTTGARLRFVARSVNGSGRGFAKIDFLAIDEAFEAPRAALSSLLPMQLASRNAQTWYTSSVEDKGQPTEFLKRLRDRGRAGKDGALAYFEYSAPDDADPDDLDARAQANPGLGVRLAYEDLQALRNSMDDQTFLTECMSVWPEYNPALTVISVPQWDSLTDPRSTCDPLAFCVEVDPERTMSDIGMAGLRSDGRVHVELFDHQRGVAWVLPRCRELQRAYPDVTFVVDGSGPSADLVEDMERVGLRVRKLRSEDVAAACAGMVDAVNEASIVHGPQDELAAAVAGARKKVWRDGGFSFGRRVSTVPIGPLVAVTLARHVALTQAPLTSVTVGFI